MDLAALFLAADVNLATARAVRASGRDAIHVEATKDRVVIRFADNPPGAGFYDIKLRFGPVRPKPAAPGSAPRAQSL